MIRDLFFAPSDGSEGGNGFAEGSDVSVYDAGGAAAEPSSQADTNPSDGAASASGAPSAEGVADGGQSAPYHTYGEQSWASGDELNQFIDQGVLRLEDYTQKTQGLADERRTFEQQQKDFEASKAEHQQGLEEYQRFRQVIETRPDVQNYLRQMVSQPLSPQQMAQNGQQFAANQANGVLGEVKKLLDERIGPIEEHVDGAKGERQIESLLSGLQKDVRNFPNGSFPADHVREEMARLSNSPNMLLEIAVLLGKHHLATHGGTPPANGGAQPSAGGNGQRGASSGRDSRRRAPGSGHNPDNDNEAGIDHGSMDKAKKAARAEARAGSR